MEGYKKALKLLHAASTPNGFVAAVKEEDNYRRIWTRDSALCGIAALSTDDEALKQTFKKSIETIFHHQHKDGFIPSNVSVDGKISYGTVVGRVDNHAWIIISACLYARVQNEMEWLQQYENGIAKSFALMNAWEFNGRGLMYVPQSADWADEYNHHGYILYNQLLRLWALRCAANVFNEEYKNEAVRVQGAIEKYFSGKEYYAPQIERMWKDESKPYWIMGFNTSKVYTQFDLQANALALLLQIGDSAMQQSLVNYIKQTFNDHLIPSFYPAIEEQDIEMTELKNNYAFRFRNRPHEFHNGGLWCVWNGFMALCMARYDEAFANQLSERIISACAMNDWDFNEVQHGQTLEPGGVSKCAWSAAGLILSVNHSFAAQLKF